MVTGHLLLNDLDGRPIKLDALYRGASVFLLCGGPSAGQLDLSRLDRPGIMVAAINNASKSLRPNIHFYNDGTHRFLRSVFQDPKVLKFVRRVKKKDQLFDSQRGQMRGRVRDCKNVITYSQRDGFELDRFFKDKFVYFGSNDGKNATGRSTFLVALRILVDLGFTRIFLLGCDFTMSEKGSYHFQQGKTKSQVESNNRLFRRLSKTLPQLKPALDDAGVEVYNCNPCSQAGTFDYMSFDDALTIGDNMDGILPGCEPSAGMYDYSEADKRQGRYKRLPPRIVAVIGPYRSGTSMTASILGAMGCDAGDYFKGKANPLGFYEDRRLGNLLKKDLCPEPALTLNYDRYYRITMLREWMRQRVAETDQIIVAKHPILTLLLDEAVEAWRVFGDVRVVATKRDLATSIASMKKTGWRNWKAATIEEAQTRLADSVDDHVQRSGFLQLDYDWTCANREQAARQLAEQIGCRDDDLIAKAWHKIESN